MLYLIEGLFFLGAGINVRSSCLGFEPSFSWLWPLQSPIILLFVMSADESLDFDSRGSSTVQLSDCNKVNRKKIEEILGAAWFDTK